LLRGETIVRHQSDDPPLDGKGRSSVPKAGSRKQQDDGDPDLAESHNLVLNQNRLKSGV